MRWSAEADEQLTHLVAVHGNRNWQAIASRLQIKSAKQCQQRWRRYLEPLLTESQLTAEEILNSEWTDIRNQYMLRHKNMAPRPSLAFIRKMSSYRTRQPWSADEDELLKHLVDQLGCSWKAIAAGMQDRSSKQCRERWENHLAPHLNKGEWTPEEDQEIQKHVAELGTDWSQIRDKYMPRRSNTRIKRRWLSMIRKAHSPSAREWDATVLDM